MMNLAVFLGNKLKEYGVDHAFGIPGGVIIDLIYALREMGINVHLCYHEQSAGFAACGFSQASGRLGVAYATRGPGIANMYTCIAEAYQEMLPVLFITSHSRIVPRTGEIVNQEFDIVRGVKSITKYSSTIDDIENAVDIINSALCAAMIGRKGPVLLDVNSSLWREEIRLDDNNRWDNCSVDYNCEEAVFNVKNKLNVCRQPIILVGDGVRDYSRRNDLLGAISKLGIPVLSSRGALDILAGNSLYFGYIGSHGVRCSNFILSKADLVISVGNRMTFSKSSKTYSGFLSKQVCIIDIDTEHLQEDDRCSVYKSDGIEFLKRLSANKLEDNFQSWELCCNKICERLNKYDQSDIVDDLIKVNKAMLDKIYVSDVGNNEYYLSKSLYESREPHTFLTSKSFGSLGASLGKCIGAFYATSSAITCVVGDQGFQMNIQELQTIISNNIPVIIVLINNNSSAMIRDAERKKGKEYYLHVDKDSGYNVPNFEKIVKAYGVNYTKDVDEVAKLARPVVLEIIENERELLPYIPIGRDYQDMFPLLSREEYDSIQSMIV